jgi:hypothetical protein
MITFAIILLGVGLVSAVIVFWMELSITNDKLQFLEQRLYKLEKDAVKVTFTSKPNPKQFDGIESEGPFIKTRKKRKPKTVGEWEENFDLGGHE